MQGEIIGGREERNMDNRQIDPKQTKQVLVDIYWHKLLKIRAAEVGKTIKELLDEALSAWWNSEKGNE